MKLIKVDDIYTLMDGDKMIASSDSDFQTDYEVMKLSKENCNEIFGVVDINKWANEKVDNRFNETDGYHKFVYVDGIVDGFNKAMELNKDKLFTLEDMRKAIAFGWDYEGLTKDEMLERYNFNLEYNNSYSEDTDKFIQSLQQPTEIEVEIEQVLTQSSIEGDAIWKYKLDENGCVILIKK